MLKIGILAILPLLFLFVGLILLLMQPPHFAILTDPEFFYLLNGLNLAQLKIFSGNYTHPGVPLELLCGFIIKATYLIAGHYPDIVTDVLHRAEFYVMVINISLIILISIIYYSVGLIILKITNKILVSIFLQSALFVNHIVLFQLTILVSERMVPPFAAFLICLLIWFIYSEHNNKYFSILLGIIIGICIMQKLTILPIIIFPFFIIKTKKDILKYVSSLTITVLILLIPIISHVKRIYEFFSNMFSHTGLYGDGKSDIIDFSAVLPNLSTLFRDMTIPMYCLIILMLLIPLVFLIRHNKTERILKIRRIMVGLAISEILIVLMILKHFKPHYLTPVAALSFFNLYLGFEYLQQKILHNRKVWSNIIIGLLCLIPLAEYSDFKSLFSGFDRKKQIEQAVGDIDLCYRDYPKIIIPRYYGTPFVEFSLFSANYYSYNIKQYGARLKELYPLSFVYTSEWGTFDMAYDGHKTADILLRFDKFVLSYYHEDTVILNSFFRELNELNKDYTFRRTLYYPKQGYVIGEIQFLQKPISQQLKYSYFNDMESDDSALYRFFTTDVAKSGQKSLKQDNENDLIAVVVLNDIRPGNLIKAKVWRYNNSNKSSLVIKCDNQDKIYEHNSDISQTFNLWNLIEVELTVPDDFKQQSVEVYLWRSDKSSDAYFDDLSVEVIQ